MRDYSVRFFFLSLTALPLMAMGCSSSDAVSPSIAEFSAFKDITTAPLAVRTSAAAVVRISMATLRGTGSFISADGLLLTNNHVLGTDVCAREGCYAELDADYQRSSTSSQNLKVFVEPQFIDIGLDVAILQVFSLGADGTKGAKLTSPASLEMNRKSALDLVGSPIWVVGHPNGRLKKWTKGDVVSTDGEWFESTAFSLPGSSGSPALDADGKVVGILHRGSGDDSLITANGINDSSILSPSGKILDLLARDATPEARGLTLMRSTADETTADEAVKNADIYLNAHVTSAVVATVPTPMLDLLGAACDTGLLVTTVRSLEELDTTHAACASALNWMYCTDVDPAKPDFFAVCPDDPTKDAWRARYQKVFDRYLAFNGAASYGWITSYPGYLETTAAASRAVGAQKLGDFLAASPQPLDFSLAAFLSRYDLLSYGGNDVKGYVVGYAKTPSYALSAYAIVSGVLSLSNHATIDASVARQALSSLLVDSRLGLGARLYVEEVAYLSKIVQ